MGEALVSIVLPTHNGARFLASAIESCIAQTYGTWELIVVDDGSTDETPQIIAEYARRDTRIRPLRHAVNRKLPAALNTGFANATGEFLTWTSDDNRFQPNALEVMVGELQRDPDIGIVYGECTLIDGDDRVIGRDIAHAPEELPYWNVVGGCFLFRRHVADLIGLYREDCFLAEDYASWLRALGKCRFHAIHEELYFYRVHAGSLSATRGRDVALATRRMLEGFLSQADWRSEWRSLAYLRLARDAVALSQRVKAVEYMLHAAWEKPTSITGRFAVPALASFFIGQSGFEALKRAFYRLTGAPGISREGQD